MACEETEFKISEMIGKNVLSIDDIVIGNMLGQKGTKPSNGVPPIRYSAIRKCLEKVAIAAKKNNARVCCPKFGAGLAGGSWDKIEELIKETLCNEDIEVRVYEI